jgi:hypothetical protein
LEHVVIVDWIRRKAVKRTRKTIGSIRSLLGLRYTSRLGEADVRALLDGRTVALVGNAASLVGTDRGAAIDAHDIIVRFNAAPLPSAVSHGAKTTIIATGIIVELELMKARGAQYVFYLTPEPTYLPRWLAGSPDLFLCPVETQGALARQLGARPTTGMMMIDILRRSRCASVDLYGFDFFASASLSNVKPRRREPHDFAAEREMVMSLLQSDPRFHLISPAPAGD